MLFDFCDYVISGSIGIDQNNAFEVFDTVCNGKGVSDWIDIAGTCRETRSAFLKAVSEYIVGKVDGNGGATSIPCNNALCSPGPIIDTGLPEPNKFLPLIYNDFYNLNQDMILKWDALMDHLEDVQTNPTTVVFNQAFYDDYLTAWKALICQFRKLMKILDNDTFADYIP